MGIIENAKEIASIIQKADNIELYSKIIDLQGDIMRMMEDMNQIKEENESLLKLQDISDKMVFKDPYWYFDNEKTPSCPKCWDGDKKQSHLVEMHGESLHCPTCGVRFLIRENKIINIYKKY